MSPNTRTYALLTIRVILGGLFLLSGVGKLIDSSDAIYLVELLATEYYWLIEYGNQIVVGTSIIELLLAVLLFWGRQLRWVFSASFLLVLSFTVVIAYFYLQGMSVASCGCFGAFGGGGGLTVTLLRNAALLLLVAGGLVMQSFSSTGERSTAVNR
ncbi:MAG: DoxX family membrane protein [Balneolaceae bacterium]|nr:DoxX family membrane protein [Balneolaceae bacterium]